DYPLLSINILLRYSSSIFYFTDPPTTAIYTLSLHDALPISYHGVEAIQAGKDAYIEKPLAHSMDQAVAIRDAVKKSDRVVQIGRSEEHTSELQSPDHLVCRLLLEKKNKVKTN